MDYNLNTKGSAELRCCTSAVPCLYHVRTPSACVPNKYSLCTCSYPLRIQFYPCLHSNQFELFYDGVIIYTAFFVPLFVEYFIIIEMQTLAMILVPNNIGTKQLTLDDELVNWKYAEVSSKPVLFTDKLHSCLVCTVAHSPL